MKSLITWTLIVIVRGTPYQDLISSTFSYEITDKLSFNEAKILCDSKVYCAGVSGIFEDKELYKKNETAALFNDIENVHVIAHSFIPEELLKVNNHDKSSNSISSTYQSQKAFTLHKGKIRRGSFLSTGHDGMLIDEAKLYCQHHPKCAAFYYPVHSLNLLAPDNITFVSSVNEFEYSAKHSWYTFIANDVSKSKYVNQTSIHFDERFFEELYPRCCKRDTIPKLEEIQAVDTLERISCNISRQEFYEKYESKRKPVMLVGCDETWKAKERWNYRDLIQRFDNSTPWRTHLGSEELHEAIPWSELVDAMTFDKPFYIFDQLDREHAKVLYEDYSIPKPMQGGDLFADLKSFPPDNYGSLRWLCISSGFSGTHPHNDPHGTDAWNALTKGHKWWIIFPESLKDEELIECDESCSAPLYTPQHWYASIGVNAVRLQYPVGTAKPIHVVQEKGETIYVPYGRVHSVFNMDPTIAVTANYGSEANLKMVWEEVVTSPDRKHWKKSYYSILSKAQRKAVRESELWPPSNFGKHRTEKELESSDDTNDSSDDSSEDYLS